ncbi:M23 family metallopeptidase [Plantactinospora sp. KBS50]|uniref:M23 family metallopeptidase n=1 Tax=Plantactinospora sp. KBS50 TaxID=2024580 RepID=UPI000BAAFFB2|nr:M23 family metallopeptidase [Plantactinospora sp. KBS50]ASW57082.1 peptidase M23 [Plantactinospora sp. KBS50]
MTALALGALAAAAGCSGPADPAPQAAPSRSIPDGAAAGPTPRDGSGTPGAAVPAQPAPPASAPLPGGTAGPYVFPVHTAKVAYHRTHHDYPAADIFADCGSPVVAVTSGTVLEVSRVDRYRKSGPQGPDNGGKSVSLLGDDGVRYYGSHLSEVASGLAAGSRVGAGQSLGAVGRTGNASNVCHLHFGISPPCARTGDWWIRRGVVWPAPFLDGWKRAADTSPVDTVAAWKRANGCPPAP